MRRILIVTVLLLLTEACSNSPHVLTEYDGGCEFIRPIEVAARTESDAIREMMVIVDSVHADTLLFGEASHPYTDAYIVAENRKNPKNRCRNSHDLACEHYAVTAQKKELPEGYANYFGAALSCENSV